MKLGQLDSDSKARLRSYLKTKGEATKLRSLLLGQGIDGFVVATNESTAVKFFKRVGAYEIEKEVYERLTSQNLTRIGVFSVPVFEGYVDELLAIEMSIVAPPYILDFAKCDLDQKVEYPVEVESDVLRQLEEDFGLRWKQVRSALWQLEKYGIYYHDANCRNVRFGDEDES